MDRQKALHKNPLHMDTGGPKKIIDWQKYYFSWIVLLSYPTTPGSVQYLHKFEGVDGFETGGCLDYKIHTLCKYSRTWLMWTAEGQTIISAHNTDNSVKQSTGVHATLVHIGLRSRQSCHPNLPQKMALLTQFTIHVTVHTSTWTVVFSVVKCGHPNPRFEFYCLQYRRKGQIWEWKPLST